ncbi:hypothetical protein QBC46DRAFT_392268 [Diplogelasinospora grovesii]|uniref:HMG box domain-containing protein n=1 Tax=Diplogelasinospora grovesii TaxID=303347 RepID=A0AAN6N219_9PEZI|nr:hypothetical protein QBC46DRAFT_392268 [Diplogelasinospora grovesii]
MAPATSVPPALPPSVEEAYRRKCIQLKQRTNEVEEANNAARLRLLRLKRQVEKMRLERAFLLEQLAKRTSTNVEDSEGSPSPPPTPKEKPLRIKRGHRKQSTLGNHVGEGGPAAPSSVTGGPSFLNQSSVAGNRTHSPSSDAFTPGAARKTTNGVHKAPKKPGHAFDIYCEEARKEADTTEEELARSWKELSETHKDEYQLKAEREMARYLKDKDAYDAANLADKKKAEAEADADEIEEIPPPKEKDEDDDVEMGDNGYDTDDQETQSGEKPDADSADQE